MGKGNLMLPMEKEKDIYSEYGPLVFALSFTLLIIGNKVCYPFDFALTCFFNRQRKRVDAGCEGRDRPNFEKRK